MNGQGYRSVVDGRSTQGSPSHRKWVGKPAVARLFGFCRAQNVVTVAKTGGGGQGAMETTRGMEGFCHEWHELLRIRKVARRAFKNKQKLENSRQLDAKNSSHWRNWWQLPPPLTSANGNRGRRRDKTVCYTNCHVASQVSKRQEVAHGSPNPDCGYHRPFCPSLCAGHGPNKSGAFVVSETVTGPSRSTGGKRLLTQLLYLPLFCFALKMRMNDG